MGAGTDTIQQQTRTVTDEETEDENETQNEEYQHLEEKLEGFVSSDSSNAAQEPIDGNPSKSEDPPTDAETSVTVPADLPGSPEDVPNESENNPTVHGNASGETETRTHEGDES